jgi:hypothetical protein
MKHQQRVYKTEPISSNDNFSQLDVKIPSFSTVIYSLNGLNNVFINRNLPQMQNLIIVSVSILCWDFI